MVKEGVAQSAMCKSCIYYQYTAGLHAALPFLPDQYRMERPLRCPSATLLLFDKLHTQLTCCFREYDRAGDASCMVLAVEQENRPSRWRMVMEQEYRPRRRGMVMGQEYRPSRWRMVMGQEYRPGWRMATLGPDPGGGCNYTWWQAGSRALSWPP